MGGYHMYNCGRSRNVAQKVICTFMHMSVLSENLTTSENIISRYFNTP